MNALPAQEIKRRGLAAIDELIEQGPVHIIKNNLPRYVVLTEERYKVFLEQEEISYKDRLRQSLADVKEGKVHRFSNANDLLKMLEE